MKSRRGFVLPAVLMLISVLLLFAAVRHYFSRNQLIQASHDANYEKSFHLAIGGIESADNLFLKAIAFFNDGRAETLPKLDKAPTELAPILKALLNADGLPYSRKERIPIESSMFTHLQSSWEKFATLKVEIELRDIETLVAQSPFPGPIPDPREARILVMLHAEAVVNGAVARVCRYREAKLVNILPSILGKFALYLRQQGPSSNNSFEDSLSMPNLLKDTPLMVFSGKSSGLASLNPADAADFFESQGWVFLGGDAPWVIGSGPGGGNANYASALQKNDLQTFPILPPDEFSSLNFLSYYSQPEYLSPELKAVSYNKVLSGINDELFSSRIRISGSRNMPTPTNVVGKVIAKSALIQGLKNTQSGLYAPYPFLQESQFNGSAWPGMSAEAAMTMEENFGGVFQRYKSRMSVLIEERYNAINLRALNFPAPPMNSSIMVDPRSLPAGTAVPETSKRLHVDNNPASFIDANSGNLYQLFADDGRKLFEGNLSGFEDLSHFVSKAVISFDKQSEFYKEIETEKKEYLINNIYLIKDSLLIDRPLQSIDGCGGIIIVNGDITIQSEIIAPDQEPIVLISTGGNIRIATSARIQAGLVALKGQIHAESAINVNGIISAKELSMAKLSPLGMRQLSYNANFDVTDSATYMRGFRLFMPKDGITFVK
ncbi:MAG: hypothetical protein ACD_39C00945G0006 [uncultured bacterium]|nr:MAG: hypothetical protein ACD_39C00945G0006 [uncultured bacterium]